MLMKRLVFMSDSRLGRTPTDGLDSSPEGGSCLASVFSCSLGDCGGGGMLTTSLVSREQETSDSFASASEITARRSRRHYQELVQSLEAIVWRADAATLTLTN